MDQRSFQRLLRRTVAMPVALLVCLAAILAAEVVLLSSSLHWVDHSNQVIASARRLVRSVVEMDTALRGYYLSGDQALLQSYREAKTRADEEFDVLTQLTADNPTQQRRAQEIGSAAQAWGDWADQLLARAKPGTPTDAELLAGQNLLEAVRESQRTFVAREQELLDQRWSRAKVLNATVIGSAVGLSLLTAVILFTLTRRELLALSSTYERHLQAEAEQRRQVSESREWFQSTLNSLGEAVISTDSSATISYINPVAQQLTGWEHSEARGVKFGDVVHLTDERTKLNADDPIALVSRAKNVMSFSNGLLLTSRDGAVYPIELTGAPILDRRGEILGTTVVLRDMTQRRQTEQTLRSSERLSLAGRLSATIAHEIRNPLDTVSNLLYLLQHENTNQTQAHYLSMASEELARIAQITGQLLTFHRESRSPISVNVSEVLESALALFAPRIRQNHITVLKSFETSKTVRGFPGELRQVFSNLVGNAVEVIPSGGTLLLHVRESSLASDPLTKGVRVTVLDSGSGIPAGVRKNLFAPFYTTKGEKGTGLGLWISRSIVEKHEGTIHFTSSTRDGKSGTAFSVFLPFEQKHGLLDVTSGSPSA
jgi:PAS domain S-box-containing protein